MPLTSLSSLPGDVMPRGVGFPKLEFKITGDREAARGMPLPGTFTTTMADGTKSAQSIELLEISRAPLPPSLFEIPEGYRPALRLPNGGVDMSRPDTLLNRVYARWRALWAPRPRVVSPIVAVQR
jgi:hypothetical protein